MTFEFDINGNFVGYVRNVSQAKLLAQEALNKELQCESALLFPSGMSAIHTVLSLVVERIHTKKLSRAVVLVGDEMYTDTSKKVIPRFEHLYPHITFQRVAVADLDFSRLHLDYPGLAAVYLESAANPSGHRPRWNTVPEGKKRS